MQITNSTPPNSEKPNWLLGSTSMFFLASTLYVIAFTATDARPHWSAGDLFNAGSRIILAGIVVFIWRPIFLHRNRAFAFILVTVITISLFSVIDEIADYFIYPPDNEWHSFGWNGLSWALINGWTAVTAVLALVLFADGLEERRRVAQYQQLDKAAQLTALRQQLNPHILLNGLNNIYALTIQKSPHAAPAILELTDILRYALYETEDQSVALTREIKLLKNYIAMQKLGLEDRVEVVFNINGNVEEHLVAPLIFLPIVENAFKHGTNADQSGPVKLRFKLKVTDNRIDFESSNPYFDVPSETSSRGVGLDNVRSRLQLAYKDRQSLRIQITGDNYLVKLVLHGEPK